MSGGREWASGNRKRTPFGFLSFRIALSPHFFRSLCLFLSFFFLHLFYPFPFSFIFLLFPPLFFLLFSFAIALSCGWRFFCARSKEKERIKNSERKEIKEAGRICSVVKKENDSGISVGERMARDNIRLSLGWASFLFLYIFPLFLYLRASAGRKRERNEGKKDRKGIMPSPSPTNELLLFPFSFFISRCLFPILFPPFSFSLLPAGERKEKKK